MPHIPQAPLLRRAESSAGRKLSSTSSRTRLEARGPVVSREDSISDLIDFVRAGPQSEKGAHRIPRTVAPFRTTMDSDQMNGAVAGREIDASLPEGRYSQVTQATNATNTPHSSVNSQSALLAGHKTRQHPTHNPKEPDLEDLMPKRKTRRVVDPYAIDLSDDDEMEVPSRPKPIKEESLADFLRNVPPPPEPPTPLPFETFSRPSTSSKSLRKMSSTGIMSRFTRHGSKDSIPQVPPKSSARGQSNHGPISRPITSHVPISVQYSTMAPPKEPSVNNHFHASQTDTPRPRAVQRSYEPREAQHSARRTNDLADFLMSTPPPPSTMQAEPQPFATSLHNEEAGAFRRMFGRKKSVH